MISSVRTIFFDNLLLGFIYKLWHPCWIVFLCIPVIESIIDAIKEKDIEYFEYPLLMLVIYLTFGYIFNIYNILWIVFLTVPIYERIIEIIKKK